MSMGSSSPQSEVTSSKLGWDFSNTGSIEEDAVALFSIIIFDKSFGSIASTDIDITGITVELAKSTGGGGYSAVGITQPVFGKADGRVYVNYRMLLAEWEAGDMYRMKATGITADIDGDTKSVPAAEWSNVITELVNIETKIDAIKTKTDLLIEATYGDSFIKITTDAGVNDFAVLRFDIANATIEVYDSDAGSNWKTVSILTASAIYRIYDLIFDLLNSPTAGKDFEALSVNGDITFALKRQVTNNLVEEGQAKKYTAGAIEADPITDSETGNVIVDDFSVSDYVEVWIMTSQALTDLEIPLRFNYDRIG